MSKWADYAITAVNFKEENRHILKVKLRKDNGEKLSAEQITSRSEVTRLLENNVTFVTAYTKDNQNWTKGDDVGIVNVNGTKFIRTDGNSIAEDNLGELPTF